MLNLPVILAAAFIPTIVGFLYYNPKIGLGKAWMNASGVTEEMTKTGNMVLIFGISIFLSILLGISVNFSVIHQAHIDSLFAGMTDEATLAYLSNFHDTYGHLHRSFKHGVIHGLIMGFFVVLPVLGTNALFERKGFKYIAVNVGYWIITLALMGGVICQFS